MNVACVIPHHVVDDVNSTLTWPQLTPSWVTTTKAPKFDSCGLPQPYNEYLSEHYVTSLYWTITTLMSVGYGDIHAQVYICPMVCLVLESSA
jgi:hypothetical protein